MAAFPNVMDDASVSAEQHAFVSREGTRADLFSQQAARLNSHDTFIAARGSEMAINNYALLQALAQDMQLGRESPQANTLAALRGPYGPLPIPAVTGPNPSAPGAKTA